MIEALLNLDQSLFLVFVFALIFEIVFFNLEQYVTQPPSELKTIANQITETKQDLCKIKSIQLELVKHSKLTRRLIKLEKQTESIKEEQAPRVAKWQYIMTVARVIIYAMGGILACQFQAVVFAPSKMLWPLSSILFFEGKVFELHPVMMLFVSGLGWQYVIHTLFAADRS